MTLLGHRIEKGMTWDEIQPLVARGKRIYITKSDPDSFLCAYQFAGQVMRLMIYIERQADSPYRVVEWTLF